MPKKKNTSRKHNFFLPLGIFLSIIVIAFLYSYKQVLIHSANTIKTTEASPTVMPWEDHLKCDTIEVADRKNWKTFSDAITGIRFEYPVSWKPLEGTQRFEHGDLIGYSYSTTNNEVFKGGGGYKTNGATLVISKPVSSEELSLDDWFEENIHNPILSGGGIVYEQKKDLKLGNKVGTAFYSCSGECATHAYTKAGNTIWGMNYTVREDYAVEEKQTFKSELCGILDSLVFQEE